MSDTDKDKIIALLRAEVKALQDARKAPLGHIIDDQGVMRRVLGTFKLTDDGCAIGSAFAAVWCLHAKTKKAYQTTLYGAGYFRQMWSTKEAAEKAKEAMRATDAAGALEYK